MIWTPTWYDQPIDDTAMVPRIDMPQIKRHDYPALMTFLTGQACTVSRVVVNPADLRFHQSVADFDPKRIPTMHLDKPALIARDRFILDGNHRAMAKLYEHADTMDAFELDRDFEAAIKLLFAFPNVHTTTTG